jgi:hypothetical protein
MGLMLVGRDRELSALDELLRRAELGDRPVAVITGEPGIGKSRLLDALAQRVQTLGGRVAWGRTSEVGLTPAFWPWLQILTALDSPDDRAPQLGVDEHAVSTTRLARFAEVAAFLARRAQTPVALLFDDLHAADPSSLQLLEHVLPMLSGKKILVAIAARDGDATPDVASALGRLQRHARRFQLARLSRGEVDALVGGRADAERIFALSEGNPLFVEELVASLEADGTVRLPQLSSVRAVIRERVARLPAATGASLVAAAVIGRHVSGKVVADMLGIEDVGAQFAPALRLGMISETGPDRFRFSHALVAEAIADELDPSERARLHLRAATALDRHASSDLGAIAHHLLAAGHLAADAAVTAAERAARDAMSRLAFEDAAALLARAQDALQLAAPADTERRARLICARAEALQHAGDHARANAACEQAVLLARALGDGDLFGRIAVVRGLEFRFGATDHALVEMLREALERLAPAPSALRARLLARLAAAMQPAIDPAEPVARARQAIVMAREFPANRERLATLYTAAAALIDYVPAAELGVLHGEVLDLARALGDRTIVVHTMLRRCFVALELIDRAGFEREAAAFVALATELGVPRWFKLVPLLAAVTAVLDGRFDEAERAAAEAEHRMAGDEHSLILVRVHRALAASVQTRTYSIDPRELTSMIGARLPLLAWLAAVRGDIDEARAQLVAHAYEPQPDPNMAAMLVTTVVAVGDARAAAICFDQLAARTGGIVLASMVGFAVQDLFDRMLLQLAMVCERWDVIDLHAERALAIAHRLSSPVWIARIRADWGDALARRGRDDDRDRARELWAAALPDARRFEMTRVIAACTAGLGGAAGSPQPTSATSPAITISRAGELWLVEGAGEQHHLRDSRGMQMLAKLVAEPGRELHALDLAGATEGVDGGDAGPPLDATARAQYRERIAELHELRERAEAWGDPVRAERAAEELDVLTRELSRAFGLGGRARPTGAAAERARSNVQRRLQHALQQIRAASPRVGDHLEISLTTGMTCVYNPRG